MLTLHNYQSATVSRAIEYLIIQDCISVLIQSATGSGKTVIAAGLIRQLQVSNPSYKFLIVVPSMTLVEQFYNTLVRDMDIPASVLHNTLKVDKHGRPFSQKHGNIIITMPETFAGVVAGTSDLKLPLFWKADFLVMDEAHKNTAASSQAAKEFFDCKIIGLSATPRREQNKDGEHLWSWYGDRMIIAASIKELIRLGYIVKPKVIRRPKGSVVVTDWLQFTKDDSNKRTILVTNEVVIAQKYEAAFREMGVKAQLIEGKQTMTQRQHYFKQFEDGHIDVLCSVDSLCEGFDCKPAKHLIIDRSMVSVALMHQCAGRVLRADGVKTEGFIYNYGDNAELDNIEDKVWTQFDYAPDVSNIVRGAGVTVNEMCNKTLAYACEAVNDNGEKCLHVYDAMKHAVCEACQSPTDFTCRITTRDLIAKVAGQDNVGFEVIRALKACVAEANTLSPKEVLDAFNAKYNMKTPEKAKTREKAYANINVMFFNGQQVIGGNCGVAAVVNKIFALDLNVDDYVEFSPHENKEMVELLAA